MLRRLKREVCFLIMHYRITGLCAFLFCMGGILLWVSGGSNLYYLRGAPVPIGGLFLLWLLIYGLTGVLFACILLTESFRCRTPGRGGILTGLCASAYVFMLCWYAVYFCTRLLLFSGILLILTVIVLGIIFVVMRTELILVKVTVFLIEIGQILCLVYCYSMNLLI